MLRSKKMTPVLMLHLLQSVYEFEHPDVAVRAEKISRIPSSIGRQISSLNPGLPKFPRGNRVRWLRRFIHDFDINYERPVSWLEALYEFTQNTTFHGVRYIFDVDNVTLRRLFWFCCCVACLGGFSYNLNDRLRYFLSSPTMDVREIIYVDHMLFPAVTICNHNMFRTSMAAKKKYYDALTKLFDPDKSAPRTDNRNESELWVVTKENMTTMIKELDHQKENMIFKCTWQGNPCSFDDFRPWLTDNGMCYTFNGDRFNPIESYHSGPTYGLQLVLNVEQYEYMAGPSNTAGIKVIIHNQTEALDYNDRGIDVPPGFQASVGVSVIKISSDSPKKDCGSSKLRYFNGYDYTSTACDLECMSDYIKKMCKCHRLQIPRDPKIPENETLPNCNLLETYSCVKDAKDSYKAAIESKNFTCDMECKETCSTAVYTPIMSYAALSRYNAEKILLEEPDKIGAVEFNFLDALERSSRRDKQKVTEAKNLFKKMEDIYTELTYKHMTPDIEGLRTLQDQIFNITCFVNARKIVSTYWNLTMDGLNQLKTLNVFNYDRSFYITNYLGFLGDMRINLRNFETLITMELAQNDKEEVGDLSKQVDVERIREVGMVTAVSDEISHIYRNLKIFASEHVYLKNLTGFNTYFSEGLDEFHKEITKCLSTLNKSIDSQLSAVRDQIRDGSASVSVVRNLLSTLSERRKDCEVVLVDYSRYNRDNGDRLYDRLVSDIDSRAKEIFANFLSPLRQLKNWDFQVNASADVYPSIMRKRSRYTMGETKLVLAINLTDERFQTDINLLLGFIENVGSFLSKAREVTKNYLDEFVILNDEIPEVIRELYKQNDLARYRLYFQGYLFNEEEVRNCSKMIGKKINGKQSHASSLSRAFFFAWRDLRDHLNLYKQKTMLNADFVLTNFAQVSIFFDDLRFENVDKQMAYELFAFISDLGGSFGLFFGASFLTIVEIFDVIVYNIYKKTRYKKFVQQEQRRNPNPLAKL